MVRRNSPDVTVIGAGFAGAATAYHLCKKGLRVLLLDMEKLPGMHSSGRSAAMVRSLVQDASLGPVSLSGARFFHQQDHDSDFPVEDLFRATGGIYSGDSTWVEQRRRGPWFEGFSEDLFSWLTRDQLIEKFPLAASHPPAGAMWCSLDGVVDAGTYLNRLIERAGPRLETGLVHHALTLLSDGNGVTGLVFRDQHGQEKSVSCSSVVNAAGAFADVLARSWGLETLGLKPLNRHLFQTQPNDDGHSAPDLPFYWNESAGFYLRPESGAWLLTACDETGEVPGHTACRGEETALLAEKLSRYLPDLGGVRIQSSWAGQRTFAPDRRFVLGPDPRIPGLHWCAALGGHGVTCAWPAGKLVADALASGTSKGALGIDPALSPARFLAADAKETALSVNTSPA